jgi:nuclear transport factor 2 (NTF2) superfamily protein
MTTPTQAALVPPFTRETAAKMVPKAEDGWNSRDPGRVSLINTLDSKWRNRAGFVAYGMMGAKLTITPMKEAARTLHPV